MQSIKTAIPALDYAGVFEVDVSDLPAPRANCHFTSTGELKSWIDEDGYVQRTSIPENRRVLNLQSSFTEDHSPCNDLNGPAAYGGSIYTSDNWDYTAIK